MSNTKILQEALQLSPQERSIVVENLLKSLDVWAEEAKKRLQKYRGNNIKTIPFHGRRFAKVYENALCISFHTVCSTQSKMT